MYVKERTRKRVRNDRAACATPNEFFRWHLVWTGRQLPQIVERQAGSTDIGLPSEAEVEAALESIVILRLILPADAGL